MNGPSTDRLALLYRVSQTFNSSLDLDQVLEQVMDEVIAATKAERGFLMLAQDGGDLFFRAARGMDQRTLDEADFHVSRGVIDRVAREGVALLTSNAQMDDRLVSRQSIQIFGLRSILCVPLQLKGKPLGLIYVDNRLQAGIFTNDDLELLTAIASSAAIAIENARLYQVAVEKGRLERELQMAREVQAKLIPQEPPSLKGWEFAAAWQPAREAAGDFYDFIELHSGQLGIVIGDVSDKGMPAALFMALTRSVIRASLAQADQPNEAIYQANRVICGDSAESMFLTLFYGQLDAETGNLVYVNAGHNPPFLYRAATGELQKLTRTGMALGIQDEEEYQQQSVRFEPGDWLFLYTDGVTDATSLAVEEYSEERLVRLLLEWRSANPKEQAAALEADLRVHVGTAAPFDDITLVIMKRL